MLASRRSRSAEIAGGPTLRSRIVAPIRRVGDRASTAGGGEYGATAKRFRRRPLLDSDCDDHRVKDLGEQGGGGLEDVKSVEQPLQPRAGEEQQRQLGFALATRRQ
jgi:hypothetical protein